MGVIKSIYPNLSAQMRKQKLYQKDIAEWLGVRQTHISYRFTGRVKWKVDEIYKVMEHLDNKDFLYLFKEER